MVKGGEEMASEKRLIDANAFILKLKKLEELMRLGDIGEIDINMLIASMPTVDAVEVVHGRWETVSSMLGYLCCSQCKDVYIWETWLGDGKWNYCPNCGAKMDGDVNG